MSLSAMSEYRGYMIEVKKGTAIVAWKSIRQEPTCPFSGIVGSS